MSTTNRMDFLTNLLPEERVSVSDVDLQDHAGDFGTPEEQRTQPEVVVWPESRDEVSRILTEAFTRSIPVTPYALGTSLEGHTVPVKGGISLDLTNMDSILDVRPDDFVVVVEPGVVGENINEHVKQNGLFFPPLPSSGEFSTIGGMIANDASGMYTVRYGEVADWVTSLEAVLPDGSVINAGSQAAKSSSGYNLKNLLIGSEGTLAVITKATLELVGLPEQKRGGRAVFKSLEDASSALADAVTAGVDVAAIELIDALSARMANDYLESDLPNSPMLFVEFHANHGIEKEIDFARSIFETHNVERLEMAESQKRMNELWTIREELAFAVGNFDPSLEPTHPGDVTVPISQYPSLIERVKQLANNHDVLVPCFGHGGDGNLHYTVLVNENDDASVEKGEEIYGSIVQYALDLGGTSTGEHGIGLGKSRYMIEEHGEETVELMKRMKTAFDPRNILNPDKIFP